MVTQNLIRLYEIEILKHFFEYLLYFKFKTRKRKRKKMIIFSILMLTFFHLNNIYSHLVTLLRKHDQGFKSSGMHMTVVHSACCFLSEIPDCSNKVWIMWHIFKLTFDFANYRE